MNISSLVINLKDEKLANSLLEKIETLKECELIASQDKKVVIVVTTSNTDEQLAIFKTIERFSEVDTIGMVYNYEELDEDIEMIKNAPKTSKVLDDDFDAKDVKYSGSMHQKTS
ncbi:chaperone NapD [Campylobacter geochelonis]|uniref:Periplasmic nitrate reductase component NapD n=1 Tax=Campylobacter geochelonis TaxID=1780362 RepID=A0A128EF75_9BACT|nr:chaperone NapD [Campylobacter geochelonis]QKF71759.1 periplasmic nitrate reductase assembly protein [Campylobacter geochelonis]CZE47574.1 periplasmic nitrate reductase component NapD [Campylobacter geochelonis]CZE48500.1 periplasmic nitrate reductase component NapD [Campylobacter geochelonis]